MVDRFFEKNRAEAKKVSIYEYDEERHMRQTREITGLNQEKLDEVRKKKAGMMQK